MNEFTFPRRMWGAPSPLDAAARAGARHWSPGMFVAAALALALAPPALLAQDRIQERHELRADASVEIRAVSHSIQVERWDRNEIEITGDYDAEQEELDVRQDPGSFRFHVRSRDRRGSWTRQGRGELTVRVPQGVRLDVGSVSGGIDARGVSGPLSLQSVSGSVTAAGSPRSVTLESVSGSVRFTGTSESVRANTVSGSVTLEADAPSVDAASVSGTIRVTSRAPGRAVSLASVSGPVTFAGPLERTGSLKAESHSGRVELELSGEVDATFSLSTFSGRVEEAVAGARDVQRSRGRFTPGEEVSFIVGTGNARVEAKSFSGHVRVSGGGG